jgi:phage-related protein (TIGR01555 family)
MGQFKKGQVNNPYGRAGKPKQGTLPMLDGWTNVQRGLGMSRDTQKQTYFEQNALKSNLQNQLEALYTTDWIGRKVVDIPIDDAMRKGVIIEHKDVDKVEAVEDRLRELKVHKQIDQLVKWSRVYGSAVLVAVMGDDKISEKPSVGKGDLSNFAVLDKFNISAMGTVTNPLAIDFSYPSGYLIGLAGGEVHKDRLIQIDGAESTHFTRQKLGGWGVSIYEAGFDNIQNAQSSTSMINNLLFQSNIDVFKIKGLNDALTGQQDDLIVKRIEVAQNMKSVLNGIALDSEDEYINIAKSFAGLNELNMGMLSIVAGAFDIPLTRLLGKSADGMNATGEGDMNNYYDMVQSIQETDVRDGYEFAVKYISYDLFGDDLGFKISFPPLKQMSEAQKADIDAKQAQTDTINLQNGSITESEARRRVAESDAYPSVTLELIAEEEAEEQELSLDNIDGYDED